MKGFYSTQLVLQKKSQIPHPTVKEICRIQNMFWGSSKSHPKMSSQCVYILFSNTASEKMFKKIGLKESSRSEVFCETTLICDVDKAFCEWLKQNVTWNVDKYIH